MPFWLDILHQIREQSERSRRYALLAEGVDDPGVLKCVFMAGGPGSGKSYVAGNLFGITPRFQASFSSYGLKLVNSDTAFELALKQHGVNPKDLASLAAHPDEWARLMAIRDRAKSLTQTQQRHYESRRLGLIIDGTGDDFAKIRTKVQHAEALGYDCYMIFVQTSLETAQARNAARARSLPAQMVADIWTDVKKNADAFEHLFTPTHFTRVDNDDHAQTLQKVDKQIRQWMRDPIHNPIGKQWLALARRHRP